MDYGQYIKNPIFVSFEEFKQAIANRERLILSREFRSQSDHLVDNGENKKSYSPVLQIVYSTNKEKEIQRKREFADLISKMSKD